MHDALATFEGDAFRLREAPRAEPRHAPARPEPAPRAAPSEEAVPVTRIEDPRPPKPPTPPGADAGAPPTVDDLLRSSSWEARVAEARAAREKVLAERGEAGAVRRPPPWEGAGRLETAALGSSASRAEVADAPPPAVAAASPAVREALPPIAATPVVANHGLRVGLGAAAGLLLGAAAGFTLTPHPAETPLRVEVVLPEATSVPPGPAAVAVGTRPDVAGASDGQATVAPRSAAVRPEARLDTPIPPAVVAASASPADAAEPMEEEADMAVPAALPPILDAPADESAPVVPPGYDPAAVRVAILVPPGVTQRTLEVVEAGLRADGFTIEATEHIVLAAPARQVRFFHAADAAAARDVAATLGASVAALGDYRPLPEKGRIEIVLEQSR